MRLIVHKTGNCTVKKDCFIALENSETNAVSLLLQGKLDVYISSPSKGAPVVFSDLPKKCYRLFDLDQNIFIGANDLLRTGKSSLTITSSVDCNIYAYVQDSMQSMMDFIFSQKDYGGYILNSVCNLIKSSQLAYQKLYRYCMMTESLYKNLCTYYMSITEEYGLAPANWEISKNGTTGLAERRDSGTPVPVYFSKQFIESFDPAEAADFFSDTAQLKEEIDYYVHLFNIPTEPKKAFFAADRLITEKHIAGASECLEHLISKLSAVISRLESTLALIYQDNNENCYHAFLNTACAMRDTSLDYTPALGAANYILDKLKEISAYINTEYKHNIGIDFEYLEHYHENFVASLKSAQSEGIDSCEALEVQDHNSLPEELLDSASRILQFAEISEDKEICFMMNLTAFRNLKDRLSADESARTIRSAITDLYFEIYQKVFKKAIQTKDQSRLLRMFLNYGYMDEKLLDYSQTMAIYKLAGANHETGIPNVYFMSDWLEKIYSMEKDPSINNFGNDYFDTFRELKRQGKVTDKDKVSYESDAEGRLSFEVNNMMRLNHRLCHGQIALYFPILHRDMFPYNPARSLITPAVICEKLQKILDIDYSAFHREIHFRSPSEGIEKEIVMLQVIPDFILVPVYGTRAMMWQEITGRHRNTPGRLILPVFTDENLDEMLIKLVGNFRWELCRTMMGAAWNNIAQNSLTSEYADYIQFYKKNRDLSEEAKEKVKSLVSKYQNKLRDIFTSDYELWINNESKGNPRMNKVARSIFFKYCPFSKNIRGQLEKQPIYNDSINLFKVHTTKVVRELESRYRHYTQQKGVLNPVLQSNLEFYRDN